MKRKAAFRPIEVALISEGNRGSFGGRWVGMPKNGSVWWGVAPGIWGVKIDEKRCKTNGFCWFSVIGGFYLEDD